MTKNSFNSIYKNKKVLITGHTGFKGSWLSIWLKELGADVIGYSLPPDTEPNNFELSGLDKKIKSYFGDVRDYEKLSEVIQSNNPEIIFHMAAQPLVRLSYQETKYTYETNIIGLVNLFEAVKLNSSVKAVVNVTSDKCYENKEWHWGYRETEPLGGYDPYSASKACAEIITSSYRNSFFNSGDKKVLIASARAGNVIGGGDWSLDRIIPDCVKAISKNNPVKIRNPHAIRPWQHVLEPLSGYLLIGARLLSNEKDFADAWNLGPKFSEMVTVGELVDILTSKWKGEIELVQAENAPHEATFLQLDCSKALQKLKWHSVLDVYGALDYTIEWYQKFYESNSDTYDLCINQIEDYTERAEKLKLSWAEVLSENPA